MKQGFWQLLTHEHSLKLRHHQHTSYAGLAFALILTGLGLITASSGAEAAPPAVNPQSGSVGLSGTVRGPAPSTAATIASPHNGQHTTTIPITVTGTCPANTFVLITKNNVFAGATDCGDDGTYNVQIDLFAGQNSLVARVSDALGQFGPDSATVIVFYDAPVTSLPGGSVGRQLFLQAPISIIATNPNQSLARTVTIVGGIGPYAVSWDWGDGKTSLSSQATEGSVSASHSYDQAGTYHVIVQVTDSTGNTAFLQLVTVVNGPVVAVGATGGSGLGSIPGRLIAAWPLFVLAVLLVIAFWLGERRENHKLKHQERLQAIIPQG